ncbi:MAG: FeoB-associated Cys-rich membrane protein [Firmicutes bacterium]|nr:FeoB-associated Cys-rich membrane protein [Bacillota bacterium]
MLAWLTENISTIIICAVLVAVVAAIIVSMVKNRKKGKSSCGYGCSDCPISTSCNPKK